MKGMKPWEYPSRGNTATGVATQPIHFSFQLETFLVSLRPVESYLKLRIPGREKSDLPRIVGASASDAPKVSLRYCFRTRHLAFEPLAEVQLIIDDIAKALVAKRPTSCDYLFLAADSMRA